jgi:hypothetical protein
LRQLSLDLLGRPPTEAEYAAAEARGSVDDATIEAMLASDEHFATLSTYHRALLEDTTAQLPQLSAVPNVLARARGMTGPAAATDDSPFFGRNAAQFRRGAVQLSCADVRHDRFAPDGSAIPLATTWKHGDEVTNAAGESTSTIYSATGQSCTRASPCRMDGWVEVEPYWAPGTTVRVCAFDAQTTATGTGPMGRTFSCDPRSADTFDGVARAPACGCGEHLRYCTPAAGTPMARAIRAAIEEEPLRIFDDVVRNHRDYFTALTTHDTFVNGPLAAYLRGAGGGVVFAIGADMPELPYDADWTRITRGSAHAGVLTTMAYLERFTSQRGRAQRFRQAFRCEEFASIALPPTEAQPPMNLAERAGCNGCHQMLEPLTQYWGHFRVNQDYGLVDDGSGTYATLAHSTSNPLADRCDQCGRRGGRCRPYCELYYYTYTSSPTYDLTHVGALQVAAFDWGETGLDDDRARFDGGPAALVAAGLARTADAPSVLESCAITRRAESLLHRQLSDTERDRWVPQLRTAFGDAHDFVALERAIVRDPRYRSAP